MSRKPAKSRTHSQEELVAKGLEVGVLVVTPVVENKSAVRGFCVRSRCAISRQIPISQLMNGTFDHYCCEPKAAGAGRAGPQFGRRPLGETQKVIGRCPRCGRPARTWGDDKEEVTECEICSPREIDWTKGGNAVLLLSSDDRFGISLVPMLHRFSNQGVWWSEFEPSFAPGTDVPLPRRSAFGAVTSVSEVASRLGGTIPSQYDPTSRSRNFEFPPDAKALATIWGLILELTANDPFERTKRASREAPKATSPSAPLADPKEIVEERGLPLPFVQYSGR